MAADDELEKFNCVCRALIVRANRSGIELHCDRCKRRHLVPFAALQNKESFDRHWQEWHAREKRT